MLPLKNMLFLGGVLMQHIIGLQVKINANSRYYFCPECRKSLASRGDRAKLEPTTSDSQSLPADLTQSLEGKPVK